MSVQFTHDHIIVLQVWKDRIEKIRGMDINFVTTATTDVNASELVKDLTAVRIAQITTTTITIDTTSMIIESGLTHFGCFNIMRLSKVFVTSSLNPVSHFCKRTFFHKHPHAFFMALV